MFILKKIIDKQINNLKSKKCYNNLYRKLKFSFSVFEKKKNTNFK